MKGDGVYFGLYAICGMNHFVFIWTAFLVLPPKGPRLAIFHKQCNPVLSKHDEPVY